MFKEYCLTSRLPVDNRLFSLALMLYIASLYIASRNACKYYTTFYCMHFSQFSECSYLLLGDDIQWSSLISNCHISKIRLISSILMSHIRFLSGIVKYF